MKSDAEVFGTVGGENYWLPLCEYRRHVLLTLYRDLRFPSKVESEYATTFLRVPSANDLWFTREETKYAYAPEYRGVA